MPSQASLGALDAVHPVLARVGERELGARAEERALHVERGGRQQVAVRHVLVGLAVPLDGRHHRHHAVGRDSGGGDGVGHAGHDLEARPEARGARAGERVQAEVEDLLHVPGEEDRHLEAREQRLGRARDRGGLAARVVADDGEPAAGARDAHEVAVAQGVGGAVEAGRLAVPHGQHAVVLGAGQLRGQLAAPGRGGAELLVEAGHVADVVLLDELAVARELLVEAAERRALVAGDHRRRCGGRGGGRRGAGRAAGERGPGGRSGGCGPPRAGTCRRARCRAAARDCGRRCRRQRRKRSPWEGRLRAACAWANGDRHSAPLSRVRGPPGIGRLAKFNLPLTVHGTQFRGFPPNRLMPSTTGYKVKVYDHCYPAPAASEHRPGRRRPRADRHPPGPGDGPAIHRRRALHRAGAGAGRHAPQALPGRPARGARGRDGAGAHDDAEGVRRRPRPRRRQGGDDRRRPRRAARGSPRGRRARDRGARGRLHHRRGHRHHHRRHGPPVAVHALRGRPLRGQRRRRRPLPRDRGDGLPGDAARPRRRHRLARVRRQAHRRDRARQGRLRARRPARGRRARA